MSTRPAHVWLALLALLAFAVAAWPVGRVQAGACAGPRNPYVAVIPSAIDTIP